MASRGWRGHATAERSGRKRNSDTKSFAVAGGLTGDEGNTFTEGHSLTEGHTFTEGHTRIEGNTRTKAFAGDEARADKDALIKKVGARASANMTSK